MMAISDLIMACGLTALMVMAIKKDLRFRV